MFCFVLFFFCLFAFLFCFFVFCFNETKINVINLPENNEVDIELQSFISLIAIPFQFRDKLRDPDCDATVPLRRATSVQFGKP